MNLKKILLVFLVVGILGLVVFAMVRGKGKESNQNGNLNVVVTSFVGYDFVKQIAGDKVNLNYLLKPGVEMHSYEPSPSDIIDIEKSDLFIYTGGEAETWTEEVLKTINVDNTKTLKLMDTVSLIEEVHVDGAESEHEEHEDHEEHEHAFDEHVWTSLENAKKIVQSISEELIALDIKNEEFYKMNAKKYIEDITSVQNQISEIVKNKKRNRLVFADRMPMQYFLDEFGLEASAAFNGCSTETEPSAATIAYLIDKVKEENIPVVLYIELSGDKVAKTIEQETNAKAMQIQTLHNISKTDFNNGETYVTLMTRNLEVLKKALQ